MHLNGTKPLVLRRDANNVYERVIVRLDDGTEISVREVNCLFPRIDGCTVVRRLLDILHTDAPEECAPVCLLRKK